MAKYVIDSTTLTATADAIRTKLEDTSTISPLDFAEAILSIEGGGSGGDLPFDVECGEFEVASDMTIVTNSKSGLQSHNPYEIEHSLGKIPREFILLGYASGSRTVGTITYGQCSKRMVGAIADRLEYSSWLARVNSSTNTNSISSSSTTDGSTRESQYICLTESSIYVGDKDGGTVNDQVFILKSNVTYKWIAIADKDE